MGTFDNLWVSKITGINLDDRIIVRTPKKGELENKEAIRDQIVELAYTVDSLQHYRQKVERNIAFYLNEMRKMQTNLFRMFF